MRSDAGRLEGFVKTSVSVLVAAAAAAGVGASGAFSQAPSADDVRPDPGLAPKTEATRAAPGDEIADLRTRTSRTYRRADGKLVARISSGAVNYRDDQGDWKPINTGLETEGDRLVNRANAFDLALPTKLGEPVKIAEDGASVQFALKDSAAIAGKKGADDVTFENALESTDITYTSTTDGVKEDLTLADREAPDSYAFDVNVTGGLEPRASKSRGIDFMDRSGDVRFSFAAPSMRDADGVDAPPEATKLKIEKGEGGAYELTLKLDRDWLDSKKRVYPVVVDPDLVSQGTDRDCHIEDDAPTTSFCSAIRLDVGNDGAHDHRALMNFNIANVLPKDAVVLDGDLWAWLNAKQNAGQKKVGVSAVSRDWTNAATWNTANGTTAWTAPGGDFGSATDTIDIGAIDSWQRWDVTSIVSDWIDGGASGTASEKGIALTDQNPATANVIQLTSREWGDVNARPNVDIVYERRVGERAQYPFDSQELNDRTGAKVNLANGNLMTSSNDIQVKGVGLPLGFTRYSNSGWNQTYYGQFGRGGTANMGIDVWLRPLTRGAYAYYPGSGSAFTFRKRADGSFITPVDVDADLTDQGGGIMTLKFRRSGLTQKFDQGALKEVTDLNGQKITLGYQASNGALKTITDTQGRTYNVTTNASKYITKIADPTGREWTYTYGTGSEADLLKIYTDPEAKQTKYFYTSGGQLQEIEDPVGGVTRYGYDSQSRVTTVDRGYNRSTTAKVARTSYAYQAVSAPCNTTTDMGKTVLTDPRGKNTTYCYDRKLRTSKVVDAKGHTKSNTYTATSNVDSYTNEGATTGFGYNDADDNNTGVNQPAGENTTTDYYQAGAGTGSRRYQPKLVTQPQGSKVGYMYNSFGNLGNVMDGNSPTQVQAALEYNGQTEAGIGAACPDDPATKKGTVRCAIDGNNRVTRYSYDASGNLTKISPPATTAPGTAILGNTTLTSDSLGRIKTVTDPKSQTKTYTYDKLDRVKSIGYSNGTSIAYTYDANGNLTQRNDSVHGITGYVYDKLNRQTKDTYPSSVTNDYTYDASSNLTGVTDAGGAVTYGYDDVNLMSSLTEPGSLTTTFGYNARDEETSRAFPNGVTQTTTPDSSGKPTKIEAKKATTTLTSFTYDYTLAGVNTGQRQKVTDKDGNQTAYDYDFNDRLVEAITKNGGGTTTDQRNWAYDNASNRLTQTVNGAQTSYAYNEANQLCWTAAGASSASCASPPTGATQYRYDANGNETQGTGGRTSAYNIRDQLTSLTVSGTTTNFGYAGPDQSERTSNGGAAQRNSLLGMSGQGSTYWTRDENGGLVSQRAGSKHYYLTDGLGSVVGLTDSAGGLAQSYKTDPFGVATATTGSVTNPWSFAGEYREGATGASIYKIGARNYDPTTGRWTQQDPLDQPDDLQNANKYLYAASNPVNITDPTGTCGRGPAQVAFCNFEDKLFGAAKDKVPGAAARAAKKCVRGIVEAAFVSKITDIIAKRYFLSRGEKGYYESAKPAIKKVGRVGQFLNCAAAQF